MKIINLQFTSSISEMIKLPAISVVMPCLNEELTLAICINKAASYLKANNICGEIIIADNGSTDSSVSIANSLGAKVINVLEKGYGNALMAGFKAASGKYIIMGDADDSYDFSNLTVFIDKLKEGHQMVIGNRFQGGIEKGAMPFLHRYLGNPVLSFIGRLFFKQKISDFHCGLRAFDKDAVESLLLMSSGMEFASEMIVKASLKGLRIAEVPTKLYKDGRDRKPHLRTWHDGWRHLKFLLLLCPRWLFLFPGIGMMTLGVVFSILLSINKLHFGRINLGVHTQFFTGVLYLLGFQLAMFYFFCRVHWNYKGFVVLKNSEKKVISFFSMERGLLIGLLFVFFGFFTSFYAVTIWERMHFGSLDPEKMFKIIIPAGFSVILGFQIVLTSLFLTIMGYLKGQTGEYSLPKVMT